MGNRRHLIIWLTRLHSHLYVGQGARELGQGQRLPRYVSTPCLLAASLLTCCSPRQIFKAWRPDHRHAKAVQEPLPRRHGRLLPSGASSPGQNQALIADDSGLYRHPTRGCARPRSCRSVARRELPPRARRLSPSTRTRRSRQFPRRHSRIVLPSRFVSISCLVETHTLFYATSQNAVVGAGEGRTSWGGCSGPMVCL